LITRLRGRIKLRIRDCCRTGEVSEQQTCRVRRLAGFSADANDAPPRPVRVVVSPPYGVALPRHQLNRLTDQRALGDAAFRFDPSNDLFAKGLLLVVGWHVRLVC